ncbi:hypothetical protein K505DRAFT_47053 [Melanomma pulvis-pyrius CBS 109.77]|uniref:Secreted protein n=1 Tax=Melanomma pulvis-pyrius CBS 109.77 TaxID=1314802 RepID=A0A6A6X9S1_9PLEO|nr:hypothetical protein K505DRAFT_47053 [Melanomma pulvis-pyrius CBS 109.77]
MWLSWMCLALGCHGPIFLHRVVVLPVDQGTLSTTYWMKRLEAFRGLLCAALEAVKTLFGDLSTISGVKCSDFSILL